MTRLLTGYHHASFDQRDRRAAVKRVTAILRRYPRKVGIACTGISGITIGTLVADRTGRELIIVRKEGDNAHSRRKVEGFSPEEYVIVDDFISTGSTIHTIVDILGSKDRKFGREASKCIGVILYCGDGRGVEHESMTIEKHTFPLHQLHPNY